MIKSFTKISSAIKDTLLPTKSDGSSLRLIMTLLVKNEALLLERNILFHRAMGVDGFIITDNNSTDSTPEIIQKYKAKGWVVESIVEPGTDYKQKAWVDRMIWSAKKNHSADWVINCDADEFWFSPNKNLKSEMAGKYNVLKCRVIGVYPDDSRPWNEWDNVVRPMPSTAVYDDLSPRHIFNRYTYKVAHSTSGYIKISMGNHKVNMLNKRQKESEISIFHYNILGREAFIKKMVNGGQQIEKNPKKSVARHWRYFYELYKSGGIEAEYNKIIGLSHFEEFQTLGYIYKDNRVAEILKSLEL